MNQGDSLSLFDVDRAFEHIALPDADIRLMRSFYDAQQADCKFAGLLQDTPWRQETIKVWGRHYPQPRLTAWYGDAGTDYTYSGLHMAPLPWSDALAAIKSDIEALCGAHFNSVLINLYRDERDSVGWHADNEPELGPAPLIASLSLGATRTFRLKHKSRLQGKPAGIPLTHGSLLLMGGDTQRHWLHAVDKERQPAAARINLTFRTIESTRG